ncbi:hypothetical protein OG21DRAFT_1573744 [Imleria badia]|nr:hypothetical protein OG21DRAFT_1573744 [Imleria badia]
MWVRVGTITKQTRSRDVTDSNYDRSGPYAYRKVSRVVLTGSIDESEVPHMKWSYLDEKPLAKYATHDAGHDCRLLFPKTIYKQVDLLFLVYLTYRLEDRRVLGVPQNSGTSYKPNCLSDLASVTGGLMPLQEERASKKNGMRNVEGLTRRGRPKDGTVWYEGPSAQIFGATLFIERATLLCTTGPGPGNRLERSKVQSPTECDVKGLPTVQHLPSVNIDRYGSVEGPAGFPAQSAVLAARGHEMRLRANGATDDEISLRMSLSDGRPEEGVRWGIGVSEMQTRGTAAQAPGRLIFMESTGRGREIWAISLSPDRRWLVIGLDGDPFLRVLDAQTYQKVPQVDITAGHTNSVVSLDISPDSTKFVTGGLDKVAFIWSMTTGERLLGPLQHDAKAAAVLFSPNGNRIATASKSIRIYNSDNGQQLLDIPCSFYLGTGSPLAWSADGSQLFAVSCMEVKRFDTSSGSLLSSWSVPGGRGPTSIVLARNQRVAAVVAEHSLSFWDTSTHQQIGTVITHTSRVWALELSHVDDCIATWEDWGKAILLNLREIVPGSYFTVNLPFMYLDDAAFKSWTQGDLTRVDELFTKQIADPLYHAHALAQRTLVRGRLQQWDKAIEDAKKRTVIGYIAHAVNLIGNGDHDSAIGVFDLVFTDGLATGHNNFLLLIEAIILFECGKHQDASSRIDYLIDIVNDKSLYITVRAQMSFLLGSILASNGDYDRAMTLLIFGWDFDKLDVAIPLQLQKCIKPFEDRCDAAMQSKNTDEAILQYSSALSLDLVNPAGLLVKRSKARAMMELWEEALKDADGAIKEDSRSPWGYKRRHAALHGLQRYDEAMDAFTRMLSLIEGSDDQDIRQLGTKYVLPSQSEKMIDNVVGGVSKTSPLVLIDVKRDAIGYIQVGTRIQRTAFFYDTGVGRQTHLASSGRVFPLCDALACLAREGAFVPRRQLAGSVLQLDSLPLNEKLRQFCEVVSTQGYRWAWSDTCCIDKTISTVLNQSLTMMYKWYEAAASTFVYLEDVDSPLALGNLTGSRWMTRAWTAQELLAAKVIRFYDRNWAPYLGDIRSNHKESPEIVQELANAIGVARQTIIAFIPDDLTIRARRSLASTRNATVEEDVAYSLIGIFKSDIRPHYGEGDAALGHLLEEIVARSGEVTPSSYSSCLPATLAVYIQPPGAAPATNDADIDVRVAALRNSLPQADAALIYDRVIRLPPARFANRRLHLPSVIFAVKKLGVQNFGDGREYRYRARVSGIGDIEFQTSDQLSPTEPRKLIFVHPWIRDLYDPLDGFDWGSTDSEDEDEDKSDPETDAGSAPSSPLAAVPAASMDDYTRALRMISRLQQPLHALLLQRQTNGEFKRVAAEHEILVPGIDRKINFARDIRTEVLEIL